MDDGQKLRALKAEVTALLSTARTRRSDAQAELAAANQAAICYAHVLDRLEKLDA